MDMDMDMCVCMVCAWYMRRSTRRPTWRSTLPCACHAHTMHVPCTCHARAMHMHIPCTYRAHTVHVPCTRHAHTRRSTLRSACSRRPRGGRPVPSSRRWWRWAAAHGTLTRMGRSSRFLDGNPNPIHSWTHSRIPFFLHLTHPSPNPNPRSSCLRARISTTPLSTRSRPSWDRGVIL